MQMTFRGKTILLGIRAASSMQTSVEDHLQAAVALKSANKEKSCDQPESMMWDLRGHQDKKQELKKINLVAISAVIDGLDCCSEMLCIRPKKQNPIALLQKMRYSLGVLIILIHPVCDMIKN